jgi:hypothetical protein
LQSLFAMKTSAILSFAALSHHALSQGHPTWGFDPHGAEDCVAWANIGEVTENNTCEKTLRKWGVEPERFHAWNPLVGLDCKPWFNFTSYCIMTNETLENAVYYTTTTWTEEYQTFSQPLFSMTVDSAGYTIPVTKSDATTRPYTTIPPVPSPSTWKDMGCFINNFNEDYDTYGNFTWPLDFRYVPRDPAETVDKCKQKCWDIQYKIAGLKLGNECWCGDRNNATLAENQSECDMPCAGDAKVKCGSTRRMNVWAADEASTGGTLTTASGSAARTSAGGATATASSGARRNGAFFGLL